MINYLQKLLNIPDSPELDKFKDTSMIVIWNIEDVIFRAREMHLNHILTEEEAKDILYDVDHHHDANIGVNWDVLDVYIGDVIDRKTKN